MVATENLWGRNFVRDISTLAKLSKNTIFIVTTVMNQANKDTYVLWKNFFRTYPAGQRSMDALLSLYHEDFKEIWVSGETYTKSDLLTRFSQYLDQVPAAFADSFEEVEETEDTVTISRDDSDTSDIKRVDKMTFKDGLIIERRCIS